MATDFAAFIQTEVEDAENQNQQTGLGVRRTKRMDAAPRQIGQNVGKRAALGNITNQSHRVQPSRAAKNQISVGASKLENFGFDLDKENPVQNDKIFTNTSSQPFTIHVDASESKSHVQKTRKSVLSLPLQDLYCDEVIEITDSPMVVDESMSEVSSVRVNHSQEAVLTIPEYSDDIYKYLREAETRNRPKASYMKKQPDITDSMRSILVDWLIEVAEEYKLHRETLFLSVNYIDRFLSQMSVLRGKLQLVGAACMFTASKYEEIYPPDVGEFVYITDDTYTKRQVLRMEHLVLKVLSFDIAVPTINVFTDWYLKRLEADSKLSNLTMFLSELSLVDGPVFMKYLPSVISVAALCLANYTLNGLIWTTDIEKLTQYSLADVQECLRDLHGAYVAVQSCPQKAAFEKYKVEEKYCGVSLIPAPEMLPLTAS